MYFCIKEKDREVKYVACGSKILQISEYRIFFNVKTFNACI
jgi:hypothetical protein